MCFFLNLFLVGSNGRQIEFITSVCRCCQGHSAIHTFCIHFFYVESVEPSFDRWPFLVMPFLMSSISEYIHTKDKNEIFSMTIINRFLFTAVQLPSRTRIFFELKFADTQIHSCRQRRQTPVENYASNIRRICDDKCAWYEPHDVVSMVWVAFSLLIVRQTQNVSVSYARTCRTRKHTTRKKKTLTILLRRRTMPNMNDCWKQTQQMRRESNQIKKMQRKHSYSEAYMWIP